MSFIIRRLVQSPVLTSSTTRAVFSTKEPESRVAHVDRQFDSVPEAKRNKDTFHAAIIDFKERKSRAHVEFIRAALKVMKEYGVHKDIATYKALLNIFPKGKMIPQNTWQRIMLHYPQQQNCCVKVLDEMEWHGVYPDKETHDIVVNAFGEWNFATKKIKRMMYWMPKLKYSNGYIDRRKIEGKDLSAAELAGNALRMMARDPATQIDYIKLGDAPSQLEVHLEEDWIVSGQSVSQQRIIAQLKNNEEVFVDGPFRVYLMEHAIQYIVMSTKPRVESLDEFLPHDIIGREDFTDWFREWKEERTKDGRNIHEQKDQTILAMAVCSRTNNESAHRWVEHLQKACPRLSQMVIRMRLDKGEELSHSQEGSSHDVNQATAVSN